MAQTADAQKVMARMELDKLHRGLVVELDRRLVKPNGREGVDAVAAEMVEVSQAIEVVQETMATLKGLRDRSVEQGATIQQLEAERAGLSLELRQTQARLDEASQKIATMQEGSVQAKKTIDGLESERVGLTANNEKLKADLMLLIESVMNSFSKHKDAPVQEALPA